MNIAFYLEYSCLGIYKDESNILKQSQQNNHKIYKAISLHILYLCLSKTLGILFDPGHNLPVYLI